MASLYNRADIYDLFEDSTHIEAYKKHWQVITQEKKIQTMLDVSIGSGSVTLPILELGVQLYGSDLSEEMLKKCQQKVDQRGAQIAQKCSDYRDLSCWEEQKFDCVASTGNSLPYVENIHLSPRK